MNNIILFWFYKNPDICLNRLKSLKKFNPNMKIFGLFGGKINDVLVFQERLSPYLDDFYIHKSNNNNWKWINGDLMIVDWYKERGFKFTWDSVFIIQWDMLILDSLENIFPDLKKNQVFLSGKRKLTNMIENSWFWTKKDNKVERKKFLSFKKHIYKNYNHSSVSICLFIFQIFPKIFFKKYLKTKDIKNGMLEYKVPTYIDILKIDNYKKDLGTKWYFDKNSYPLNADVEEIPELYIKKELEKKDGYRMFHPYFKILE